MSQDCMSVAPDTSNAEDEYMAKSDGRSRALSPKWERRLVLGAIDLLAVIWAWHKLGPIQALVLLAVTALVAGLSWFRTRSW
jgi:hypothetical protein